MAHSNLLGGDDPPQHSSDDIRTLGPSDSSDSGSDSVGAPGMDLDSDTDSSGTGEGMPAVPGPIEPEDTTPDQVIDDPTRPAPEDAGEEQPLDRAGDLVDDAADPAADRSTDPDAPEDGSVETP